MPRKKKNTDVPVVESQAVKAKDEGELAESLQKKSTPPSEARVRLTKEAERILSGLGITPAEMAREATEELMTPKMALVGCLQTIQRICEVSTNNIMNSVGPLNVANLGTLFGGLRGTIALAERVTMNYTRVQAALRAKDLMDAIQKKMRDAEEESARDPEAPGEPETFSVDPTDDDLGEFDAEGPETDSMDRTDPRLEQLFEIKKGDKKKLLN